MVTGRKRIYLDACCLNRPFDDQAQDRIRLESEAVLLILDKLERGAWQWIGSDVLFFEIEKAPDLDRRRRVRLLAEGVHHRVPLRKGEVERAKQLESLGFFSYDALHLACAEKGGAQVFLTTDDHFLRVASRHLKKIKVRVENPLRWIEKEVAK